MTIEVASKDVKKALKAAAHAHGISLQGCLEKQDYVERLATVLCIHR